MADNAGAPMRMRVTTVWADTRRVGYCREPKCDRRIEFFQNVRTGRFMPFDAPAAPLSVAHEAETGRVMWTVALETSHFATCPFRAAFSKKAKR